MAATTTTTTGETKTADTPITDLVRIRRNPLPQLPAFPVQIADQPVGGRLSHYIDNWKLITQDPWVLSVVENGYVVDFWDKPPLATEPQQSPLPADPVKGKAVLEQVEVLLQKNVIERVCNPYSPGFYNRFFVVPKPGQNKWRAILDLSILGRCYITRQSFKMETADVVRNSLEQGEWATSLDFTDAYFHVLMHPSSRKYLRFALGGQVYQFRALPMGLSSSARVFTRVIKVIKGYAQRCGIVLHQYIDDWMIHCQCRLLTRAQTHFVRLLACRLGFLLNVQKSELEPAQIFTFLGLKFDLIEGRVSVTEDRWNRLQAVIAKFEADPQVTAKLWQSLLGRMVSTQRVVELGMLHVRPFQVELSNQWSQRTGRQDDKLMVPAQLRRLLTWWKAPENVCQGVPFRPRAPQVQVFVDASSSGWGGHIGRIKVQGKWSAQEATWHINAQELLAVRRVLEHFREELSGKVVMIASDNATTVSYIRKQGGTRSMTLLRLAQELYQWAESERIQLRCRHIAGKLNVLADSLSRQGQVLPTEWSLHQQVVNDLWNVWDRPSIDLFATVYNRKLEVFVLPYPDEQAYAVDAMSLRWHGMYAYAYPPTAILGLVLQKIRAELCTVILIAPWWPQQAWFPGILELLVDWPISLPNRWYLLKQPQSDMFHPDPQMMKLHAWRLSSRPTERKDFLRRLLNVSQSDRKHQVQRCMRPSGESSELGVVQGVSIHAVPLYST